MTQGQRYSSPTLRWIRRVLIGLTALLVLALAGVGVFALTLPQDHLAVSAAVR